MPRTLRKQIPLVAGCLVLAATFSIAQEHRSCKVDHTPPGEADQAFARREFPHAEDLYTAMLSADPASSSAKVGIVRSELAQGKLHDALTLARKNSADHPKDPLLLLALGEAEFRTGEPLEAGKAFNAAGVLDPCIARLHYDLGQSLNLSAMAASARRELETAHKLGPEDPVIDRTWKRVTAPPTSIGERIARLEKELAEPAGTPTRKQELRNAINWARAQQNGNCQVVGAEVPSITLPMIAVSNSPGSFVRAIALDVLINGKRKRLSLDTGISGLLLSRAAAVSAGIAPESELKDPELGEHERANGFAAHVDSIRIGPMEFHNCLVHVLTKPNILEQDGVLGTDVLQNYIVTLDTPGVSSD